MATQEQRFAEIKQVRGLFPFLRESSVRWLIYSDPEFRKSCVFRMGRKVLIGIPELLKFIEDRKYSEGVENSGGARRKGLANERKFFEHRRKNAEWSGESGKDE